MSDYDGHIISIFTQAKGEVNFLLKYLQKMYCVFFPDSSYGCSFTQALNSNPRRVPQTTQRPVPSTPFPIHHLLESKTSTLFEIAAPYKYVHKTDVTGKILLDQPGNQRQSCSSQPSAILLLQTQTKHHSYRLLKSHLNPPVSFPCDQIYGPS